MYRIYTDGDLLYDATLFNEGYGVLSPKLTVEMNKAGSLDFTLPPNNLKYNDLAKLKSIVTVLQNGEELFRGRVLNDDKDFYNQKKVYCEGQLAYLLDSIQRPYSFSGTAGNLFKQYINNHNSRVDSDKEFVIGTVEPTDKLSCNNESYPTTFDELSTQILNNVDCFIRIRKVGDEHYIDLLSVDTDNISEFTTSQTIEFGVNLLDITEHITAENIFTVLIPLGKTLESTSGESTNEKTTIVSVNDGKDYLENSTAISLFGRIEKKAEWSDISSPSELKSLGKKLLDESFELAVSLSLKAVDLNLLDVNVEAIRVGDWVRVISLPHGLDRAFQCTKIVYDLVNPDNNEYSFGVNFNSLTEQQVNDKKSMNNSVSMVMATAGSVNASVGKANQAVQDVENVLTQLPTDYVNQATFDAFKTEINNRCTALENRVEALEGGTT